MSTGNWRLVNSANNSVNVQTSFPALHHLDDNDSPTFDLNFGVPRIVYYTASAYTTNNLFTGYHDQFLRELTGRDSKFVKVYVKLNENDLQEDFLRELWNWGGIVYRINKVSGYNGNGDSTTLCELIRIAEGRSPKRFVLPDISSPLPETRNNFQFEKSITDRGLNNDIHPQSKGIFITGDNNVIEEGVNDVFLINSYGQTVTESGTVIVNGIVVSGGNSVVTINSDTNADESVSWYRVDTSLGNVTITLPSTANKNKRWDFKKIDKRYDVIIICEGGLTIDGKNEIRIKFKNSNALIGFNGTNYEIL